MIHEIDLQDFAKNGNGAGREDVEAMARELLELRSAVACVFDAQPNPLFTNNALFKLKKLVDA